MLKKTLSKSGPAASFFEGVYTKALVYTNKQTGLTIAKVRKCLEKAENFCNAVTVDFNMKRLSSFFFSLV